MLRHTPTAISCAFIAFMLVLAPPARAASDFLSLGILWSARLEKPVLATPAANATGVYLPLRDGRVVALALSDGHLLWSIDLLVTSGLAIDGDRLFGVTRDALVAIDAASGAILWRAAMKAAPVRPAAHAGWVLAGEGTELVAFRASDGHLVWRQALGATQVTTATIDGDRVYVPLSDSTIAALQVTNGARVWQIKTPAVPGAITSAGDRFFAGCADDFFYSFDVKDGDRRWRWRAAADVLAPAAQDGNRVYFTALDNVVRAVGFGSGVQKWRHAMDIRPLSGPLLDDDVVVLAAAGELRSISVKDGALAAQWPTPGELAVPALFLPRDTPHGGRAVIVTGATTGDWRVYVLARSIEPRPVPLKETPGRTLSPEGPPPLPGSPPPVASHLP